MLYDKTRQLPNAAISAACFHFAASGLTSRRVSSAL
jgi:hypothetical protein